MVKQLYNAVTMKCSLLAPMGAATRATALSLGSRCPVLSCMLTAASRERCTGPHEYFSCGGACDNVCATLQEQSQKNCPIRNIRCNDMCYCDEGHARDDNGVCVPTENC
ncbi:inducible metalloproteinase inhibitor protein-like isoform X2 [Cydia pomonella]|uniref:inducible metalloproteinase inhibitor protein-like isoform X2 n=1 Tax=Cydia pomonella TaxID=82600 RepID=UPI002ADE2014|nr:inducible metalloproteinase inhibitor protein-like isoform X2 [Cydia pomonella]